MDGTGAQRESASSRAPSLTSTTSSHSHRYHHAHCGSGNTTTSSPQVSSFLQERMQRRQAEKKMSGDLSMSSGSLRDADNEVHISPVRRSTTAMGRMGRSINGDEEQNGIGVKEMEKALSTLHKQNFDLKLELYHRRERQADLEKETKKWEDECASLQTQRVDMIEVNDTLMAELEKRDKALGESIDVIFDLQAQIDTLLRERNMVRIVEAELQGLSGGGRGDSGRVNSPLSPRVQPPTPTAVDASNGKQGLRTLEHMSSFLSERSQTTTNLRDVLLNNKSSFLHLRKISDSTVDPSDINRIASPGGLSVLSKSSFASVYGGHNKLSDKPPFPSGEQGQGYENSTRNDSHSDEAWDSPKSKDVSSRIMKETSRGGDSLFTQMQSLSDITDIASPLQQVEMMGRKLSVGDSSRPLTASQGKGLETLTPSKTRAQPRTRQEKREALRRVITNSPSSSDFANSRMLPPTPDTISSSTLRRFQGSNETLSRDRRVTPQDSFTNDVAASTNHPKSTPRVHDAEISQLAAVTALTGRKNLVMPALDADLFSNFSKLSHSLPQRPRSADATTVSRSRADSSASDDSDGGAVALDRLDDDLWLREGTKPQGWHPDDGDSMADLFNVPSASGKWDMDALFGALRGSGFLGSPAAGLNRDPLDEASGTMITPRTAVFQPPTPADSTEGPPPPPRKSSVARAGSSVASSSTGGKIRKSVVRSNSGSRKSGRRLRSNSIDSCIITVPTSSQNESSVDTTGASRKTQYPPISGQQLSRSRGLSGLGGLFRRSIGGSQDMPSSATESTFPADQIQQSQQPATTQAQHRLRRDHHAGRSSVPPPATMPWKPPAVFDDDLNSATPPPIMRNRGSPLDGTEGDAGEPLTPRKVRVETTTIETPDMIVRPGSRNATPQSGRRKWLGLGRRNSLKNRTG